MFHSFTVTTTPSSSFLHHHLNHNFPFHRSVSTRHPGRYQESLRDSDDVGSVKVKYAKDVQTRIKNLNLSLSPLREIVALKILNHPFTIAVFDFRTLGCSGNGSSW